MTHGLGPGKPGPRAAKPITLPPYVENNYRIEVKITFMLIAYLVLLCEFFWEFSIFHFCRSLVDIYWHPLLKTPTPDNIKEYKRYRINLNHLIQISKKRHYKEKFSEVSKDIKQTWQLINKVINKGHSRKCLPQSFLPKWWRMIWSPYYSRNF